MNKCLDKNGYTIKDNQDVKFKRPGETVAIIGEVVDVFSDKLILVEDEEFQVYETNPVEVEVIINVRCDDCKEEFNRADLKTVMIEGISKHLHETKVCPHCDSEDFVDIKLNSL